MERTRKPAKRRGRPPKDPAQRKRNNVTIRLRDETKASLEAGARDSGRSLSEEIETRLENSLRDPVVALDAIAGGSKNASFFRILGLLLGNINTGTRAESVWDRRQDFVEAAAAMRAFFETLKKGPFFDSLPKGPRDLSKRVTPKGRGAEMGASAAKLFSDVVTLDYDDVVRRAELLGGTRLEDR